MPGKQCLIFASTALTLALTGCSTFSKEECVKMDWFSQARSAALRGQTAKQSALYFARECHAEHGVEIDKDAFLAGYSAGLKEFCTPEFSYRFASEGGQYQGTCPADAEKQVIERFQTGRILFLEKQVADLSAEVTRLKTKSSGLESSLSSCESQRSSESSICPAPPLCPSN